MASGRLLVSAVVVAACAFAPVRAADAETRNFSVAVDGKPAGSVQMTFTKQDDGSIAMACEMSIRVKVLIKTYTYTYSGREVWKNGRLQRFDSNTNDDGKRFTVAAVAAGDQLNVTVNGAQKQVRGDVWLSSYWSMPDNAKINQTVPIIDADTTDDLTAQVRFVGVEDRTVAGQAQKVNHFRLLGKNQVDLWYDTTGRLVAQDFVQDGHRTQIDLVQVRR